MALESFGSETAVSINHAVILCHDLLLHQSPETVNENFKAGDLGIWKVYAAWSDNGDKVVRIELGVG